MEKEAVVAHGGTLLPCLVAQRLQYLSADGAAFFSESSSLWLNSSGLTAAEHAKEVGYRWAQLLPVNNPVDETVLQQELRGLKTIGNIGLDGLANDIGPCEPNQSLGFCKDNIAEGRKARHRASHGRIGQHRDEEASMPIEIREGGAGLRHLHQGEDPLIHASPSTGSTDENKGKPGVPRELGPPA